MPISRVFEQTAVHGRSPRVEPDEHPDQREQRRKHDQRDRGDHDIQAAQGEVDPRRPPSLVGHAAVALGERLALVGLGLGRRWLLVPLALAALIAVPVGTVKAAEAGSRVIYEEETPYQYARVVRDDDGTRRLELNEGVATQ